MCSTAPSRTRSSATCAAVAGTSASTPPPTRSTTGRGTASSSARISAAIRPVQRAAIDVLAREASTARLPRRWVRTDEWYSFRSSPGRASASSHGSTRVPTSPVASAMGADHPSPGRTRWARAASWYTGGGHTSEAYAEPLFRAHLLGGILYAAGYGRPGFASLAVTPRSRRVSVDVRATGCLRCAGRVRVRVGGRWRTTALRSAGDRLRGTTGVLPPRPPAARGRARRPGNRPDRDGRPYGHRPLRAIA